MTLSNTSLQHLSKASLALLLALTLWGAWTTLPAGATHFVDNNLAPLPQPPAISTDLSGSCPGGIGTVSDLVTAINNANADPEADTIILASGCLYYLTSADQSDPDGYGPTGLPTISTTLTISGNGAAIQRNSFGSNFRLFYVNSSGALTLDNLTLSDGLAKGYQSVQTAFGGMGGAWAVRFLIRVVSPSGKAPSPTTRQPAAQPFR